MDKRLIFIALWMIFTCSRATQVTNVSQCTGVELAQEVLSLIDESDCSTPQRSFLGFVKGMVSGDYSAYFRHLTDDARVAESGVTDISGVEPDITNSFHQAVIEMGVSSHKILAYSEAPTNGICRINATMKSQIGPMIKQSVLEIQMVNTNGEWRIESWDVDE